MHAHVDVLDVGNDGGGGGGKIFRRVEFHPACHLLLRPQCPRTLASS